MKHLLAVAVVLSGLFSSVSYACRSGDLSKTLLVIAATPEGEDKAVVGEILTADGSINVLRSSYRLVGNQGDWIFLKSLSGDDYKFNRQHVREAGFCYKAIFAE